MHDGWLVFVLVLLLVIQGKGMMDARMISSSGAFYGRDDHNNNTIILPESIEMDVTSVSVFFAGNFTFYLTNADTTPGISDHRHISISVQQHQNNDGPLISGSAPPPPPTTTTTLKTTTLTTTTLTTTSSTSTNSFLYFFLRQAENVIFICKTEADS
jgi:hypothetical protein